MAVSQSQLGRLRLVSAMTNAPLARGRFGDKPMDGCVDSRGGSHQAIFEDITEFFLRIL